MQIVGCSLLVCAFLAGILSPADAQYYTLGQPGILKDFKTQITALLQETCLENGGLDVLMKFEEADREVDSCITNLMAGLKTPPEFLDSFLAEYCAEVPAFMSCVRRFVELLKICTKQHDVHEDIDMIYRIAARILVFDCNNSEQIAKLASSSSSGCLLSKGEEMKTCVENMIPSEATMTLNRRTISGNESTYPLSISTDEEGCGRLKRFENCAVDTLHGCEDKLGSELLHSLFETINTEIPCKNLKSYASSASVVNVAALIAALAISL